MTGNTTRTLSVRIEIGVAASGILNTTVSGTGICGGANAWQRYPNTWI
jgi:hypothetical protein